MDSESSRQAFRLHAMTSLEARPLAGSETLTISKILDFAAAYPGMEDYLPEPRDIPMLPRQWLINMCHAIIGQDFSDFVRQSVDERHTKMADRHNLNVEVDPEILDIIKSSAAVSTMKGNSAHLVKIGSKRRRTHAEMIQFRAMRENPIEAIAAKDAVIADRSQQLAESQEALAV